MAFPLHVGIILVVHDSLPLLITYKFEALWLGMGMQLFRKWSKPLLDVKDHVQQKGEGLNNYLQTAFHGFQQIYK